MRQTVIGIFKSADEADRAVQQLGNGGFDREYIDVSKNDSASKETKKDTGDSIGNFFRSLFDSGDEADRYSNAARTNERMVTVHTNSHEESLKAAEIMDRYGAIDVDDHSNRDYSKLEDHMSGKKEKTVPIIEENMDVGKKSVDSGRTRIRSRVIERPVEERLRLRHEYYNVERNPVNRKASEAELSNFKDSDVEFTEKKEVPVVSKEARVVEEVKVNKEIEEKEASVRGKVRKTDVDVDRTENRRDDDDYNRRDDRNRRDDDYNRR
jgi:stress response protein YsnF